MFNIFGVFFIFNAQFLILLYTILYMGNNRKKIWLVVGLIIGLVIIIYLNRAYANIYNTIGAANLEPVNLAGSYLVSNNMPDTTEITYVALGDSLMAGAGVDAPEESLPYLLAQKMSETGKTIDLKNFSVPGFKSSDLIIDLLPKAVAANPTVVTLLIGANDIHNQVSEEDFRKNYSHILDRLTKETQAKIYVINIPFIGADIMMLPPYGAYFKHQTEKFNKIIKELASERSLSYIDLYSPSLSLFQKPGDHYSSDLFHPSARGYKIWADIIYDSISK